MSKLNKNVILEGVFASECIDTTGEILNVAGADITGLKNGGWVNTEHISAKDGEKEKDENFQGFQTIVGRVLNAKKIFSDKDCDTDKELMAYKKIQKPLIYGSIEIFDGDQAHDNAKAAAAIAKMLHSSNSTNKLCVSVEGQTLKREGNILKETVIRDLALTLRPANRTAVINMIDDGSTPSSSKPMVKHDANKGGIESLFKSADMQYIRVVTPNYNDYGLKDVYAKLLKALDAGSTNAAPSTLTNGAALQKESMLDKVAASFTKMPSKDELSKALDGKMGEESLEKLHSLLKNRFMLKHETIMTDIYKKYKKN